MFVFRVLVFSLRGRYRGWHHHQQTSFHELRGLQIFGENQCGGENKKSVQTKESFVFYIEELEGLEDDTDTDTDNVELGTEQETQEGEEEAIEADT